MEHCWAKVVNKCGWGQKKIKLELEFELRGMMSVRPKNVAPISIQNNITGFFSLTFPLIFYQGLYQHVGPFGLAWPNFYNYCADSQVDDWHFLFLNAGNSVIRIVLIGKIYLCQQQHGIKYLTCHHPQLSKSYCGHQSIGTITRSFI